MTRRAALTFAAVVLNLMACCCGGGVPKGNQGGGQAAADTPIAQDPIPPLPPLPADPDGLIARFGKPTSDNTNITSRPKPTQLLRFISYEKQNVRAIYREIKGFGTTTAAMTRTWKLDKYISIAGIQDKLTEEQVLNSLAGIDSEAVKIASIAAANQKRKDDAAAAKAKAIEDALPKVTRANYNKIVKGMDYDQVKAILGPGRENSRSGNFAHFAWQDEGCIISITFHYGLVSGKSIIGD